MNTEIRLNETVIEDENFDVYAATRAYLQEVLRERETALALFKPGPQATFARECWCAKRFLQDLGIAAATEEFKQVPQDVTVDVAVKDARFQVKEIQPPGRRRTKEIKDSIQAARNELASHTPDVMAMIEECHFDALSPEEIAQKVEAEMAEFVQTYPIAADRALLDLLVYVNFEAATLDEPVSARPEWEAHGFRSVSVITNHGSIVFCASERAPGFIRAALGKVHRAPTACAPSGNTHIRLTFADAGGAHSQRSVLSRAYCAVRATLDALSLAWDVGWSPEQDASAHPQIVVCWGLVDPKPIRVLLRQFKQRLVQASGKLGVRVRFGPQMP